ncbi:hypothetical protein V6M83_08350 [Streptococcus anginosus]|uniref:hypothetical protein n=1 Tax=Streptococcus anginosus TaxID=1328 RepID=UPI002ED850E7
MKTVTLEEVIEAFEKQFYPLGEMQKEKMLQHQNPQAVLGELAFLMDCARC